MAEKRIRWTKQQSLAIKELRDDILVTASAGSGKTAVLSERYIDIVSNKSVDIRNILVLTFTEAAAEEMRSRIGKRFKTAILEKQENIHLRHQLALLAAADISTIHSFCKKLITEYFYELALDPAFGMIDSDEQKLLKAEALEKTIDWAWKQSNLRPGMEQLLHLRDLRLNDGFLSKIIGISNFLDSVIGRKNWFQRTDVLAEAVNPFDTDLGKMQKQLITDKMHLVFDQLLDVQKLYRSQISDDNANELAKYIAPIAEHIELLNTCQWDKFAEAVRNFKKPRVSTLKGLPDPIAQLIKDTIKKGIDKFSKLSDLAILNPRYLDKVGNTAGMQTKVIAELVKKFDQFYSQAKLAINCLDFADLEHYALKLLSTEDSNGDLLPSQTAINLHRRYKHIFVDEYQDINPVQQAILDLLTCNASTFRVGDVKQSIYAFRGAEPNIFIKNLESASADAKNTTNSLRIDLNSNFRSSKGILEFVNKIFSGIMKTSFADINYDETASLKPAPDGQIKIQTINNDKPVVELHILDEQNKEADTHEQYANKNNHLDINCVSSRQRQAAMIARRIKEMVGSDDSKGPLQIYDKQHDNFRPVEYRDIVILMRSPSKRVNDYAEMLRLAGVPISCQDSAGYFEATEISDLLCLLKVLDNPQRDIELAAVLRSPLFNVTDSELAKIRSQNKTKQQRENFYNCLLNYSTTGTDEKLAGKLKNVLSVIEDWRSVAKKQNLPDLIWQIYRQTSYLSFVTALPNGQARRANLLKLHDRAIQYGNFASNLGVSSLTRFVEFIEKLTETGQDWSTAEPEITADAVRIMSIHKSKGLEFPVVFLAELDSIFNKQDSKDDCLADADSTLGLQIIDRDSNAKLSSLAHQVIAENKHSKSLAEEMRILYVATTRARDRLILTASEKKKTCLNTILSGFYFGNAPVTDWQLRECQKPLEWILLSLADQKRLHDIFETGLTTDTIDKNLFTAKLYDQTELIGLSEYVLNLKKGKSKWPDSTIKKTQAKKSNPKLLSQIKESLAWQYKHENASLLPAKSSITQLTHHNDEYATADYSKTLTKKPLALSAIEASSHKTDSQSIGTATHLVIAQLDLTKPVTKKSIEQTKEKLLADGRITQVLVEQIDTRSIAVFFESQLGQLALDTNNIAWREWPFTLAVPARQWKSNTFDETKLMETIDDETIIVQGIIDMLIKTPQGLLVVDFKTDRISSAQTAERAKLYHDQLSLYAVAAKTILKTNILSKWLYFLNPNCAIEIL